MRSDAVLKSAATLAWLCAGLLLQAQAPGLRCEPLPPASVRISPPPLSQLLPMAPSAPLKAPAAMPKAYAYEELGIFCKWEVKMEKSARLPIKVRLGEVQYVERMEGKLRGF